MLKLNIQISSSASMVSILGLEGRFVVDQDGAAALVANLKDRLEWQYAVLHLTGMTPWKIELSDTRGRSGAPFVLPLEMGKMLIAPEGLRPAFASGLQPGMIAITDQGAWFVAKYWHEGELALVRISDGVIAPLYDFQGLISDHWSIRASTEGPALLSHDGRERPSIEFGNYVPPRVDV